MIAGIFYGHNTLVPKEADTSIENLATFLQQTQPQYAFAAFCDRLSKECVAFRQLQAQHPQTLHRRTLGKTRYQHDLYCISHPFA